MAAYTDPFERPAIEGAQAINAAFRDFYSEFRSISRRARTRFERRDWDGQRDDALERLDLYASRVDCSVAELRQRLGQKASSQTLWRRTKQAYAAIVVGEPNEELARTWYNSVTRRLLDTVGVRSECEYVSLDAVPRTWRPDSPIYDRFTLAGGLSSAIGSILEQHPIAMGFAHAQKDADDVAAVLKQRLSSAYASRRIDALEVLRPVLFRGKTAYLVGRIVSGDRVLPLIMPLLNTEAGVVVDAVITSEATTSILFSFTRSYFHVDVGSPRDLIDFLRTLLPQKPVAELYICLGFNKHGKTELYRDLQRHLMRTTDRFETASGDKGMVMLVFNLPHHDMVFKIIRDRFAPPKTMTVRDVMDSYRLVFERDRVGRLVEAQEFEHLKFSKDRFEPGLLDELLEDAGRAVHLDGEDVIIEHLYTERRVRPLNLYLREVEEDAARDAVIDYGLAIRDLAKANIFPGDFLLKNFGVTRHGRVVFYDYDELCLVTDCSFRRLPPARYDEDEFASEPWFTVADNDVFPEEFARFLGLPAPLLAELKRHHGDLFTAEFWEELRSRHEAGDFPDFFPYSQEERLRHELP